MVPKGLTTKLRYYLYRAQFHLAPWIPRRAPVHLDIELSGRCNLACIMCPFGDHGDGTGSFDDSMQGMMPWHMATEAMRQARALGALSVKLNFRGEPGLAPNLASAILYARALKYRDIIINTNLTAFSTRRLEEIAQAGLTQLIVSVDGATKEVYESIRIKGKFEKLVENLEFVNQLPNRPRIRLNFVLQERNQHEVDAMFETFGHLCDELRINPVRRSNFGERKKCPQPWQRLVIMWNGMVGGCCSNWNNEAVIGRFPENSLKEIWDGKLRRGLLYYAADPNRVGGPCNGCLVGDSYK